MQFNSKHLIILTGLVVQGACQAPSAPRPDPRLQSIEAYGRRIAEGEPSRGTLAVASFNEQILQATRSFGPGSYLWEGDGVTRTLRYQGQTIATPYAPGKCHCVGATLQVYISAFEAWDVDHGGSGSLGGLSVAQVMELKQRWFVATPDETGVQGALDSFGLGQPVPLAQSKPGDLVQLWRNDGSGHSAVLIGLLEHGGQVTGLKYFSCQSGGPGEAVEHIGSGTKQLDATRLYAVAPKAPAAPPTADGGARERDGGPTPPLWRQDAGTAQSGASGCHVGGEPSGGVWILILLGFIRRQR